MSTNYERDMEDSLQQIATALGVTFDGFPNVEAVIEASRKAAADSLRYRKLRNNPAADVRIVGVGKRSGAGLDAAVDAMPAAVASAHPGD